MQIHRIPLFFLLVLFAVITILLWFNSFPVKPSPDWNDIFFESLYLLCAVTSYFLIVKLDVRTLQIGWTIFTYALIVDLLDEFTKEPDFWGTSFQGSLETIGLVIITFGFYYSYKRLRKELDKRKEVESKLQFLAHYDSLTSLPNRSLFMDRLHQAIALTHREEKLLAVHFLDLDNFKDINDSLGHDVGDRLLEKVASRLRECIRESDTVSRWGGDEFVIIQAGLDDITGTQTLAQKIIDTLAQPFTIDDNCISTSVSIGIATLPIHANDQNDLLKYADIAMYQAKKKEGNNYVFSHLVSLNE